MTPNRLRSSRELESSESAAAMMSGRRRTSEDSHMLHPLLGGDGRISKDRRRFIVLSIFDFALILLLWLICTVSKSASGAIGVPEAFLEEINIFAPNFMKDSLFDIVIVVCLRMVVLIVCYALLRFSHWFPVALSTGTTTVYLLIKVIFFFSHKDVNQFPQYLLVLSGFIVAWFEMWFMPFRVLPRERESQAFNEIVSATGGGPPVRNGASQRAVIAFSDDDFRSALEFTSDSEDDIRGNGGAAANSRTPAARRTKASYIKAACTAEAEARKLLNSVGKWKDIRPADPIVKQSERGAFYVRSSFTCTPKQLWQAVWVDNLRWNDQVLDAKEVLKVDERTVLFYSISAPAMRGYIASRDFLDVRRVDEDPDKGEIAGYFMSVDSHLLPPNANKKIVRGSNAPSMMKVTPGPIETGGSKLEWIMQTDLKGGLPRRVVQNNMLAFFVNNMLRLHNYLDNPINNHV